MKKIVLAVTFAAAAIVSAAPAGATPAPCSNLNGVIICASGGIPDGAVGPLTQVLQQAGIGYQGDPDALAPISQRLQDAGIGVENS